MNKLKYILSICLMVIVTVGSVFLPGFYFDNYKYKDVLEDVNQEYAGLGSTSANSYQIYNMLEHGNYSETTIYQRARVENTSDEAVDDTYIPIVESALRNYSIRTGKNTDSIVDLYDYANNWVEESSQWQVNSVVLLNLSGMLNGKMVYVQLYDMDLQLKENENIKMSMLVHSTERLFYEIKIMDERFKLELTDEELARDSFIAFHIDAGTGEADIWPQQKVEISVNQIEELYDLIHVVTAPGTLIISR